MAQETTYTEKDFHFLEAELVLMGFNRIKMLNFKKDFQRLGLRAPRKLQGREEGFFYTNNGLTVIVWTSYLEKEKKFRDVGKDLSWILIRQGDDARYFARPVRRTKSFLKNTLKKAWIAKWRVDHRPLCPLCKAFMDPCKQRNTRQYFWGCSHRGEFSQHKAVFLGWDSIGSDEKLPPKAQEYVDTMRERVAQYKKRNEKEGIIRTPTSHIRKPWLVSRPENKI